MGTQFGYCCICNNKLKRENNTIKGVGVNGKLCNKCYGEVKILVDFVQSNTYPKDKNFTKQEQAITYLSPIDIDNENKTSVANLIKQAQDRMTRIKENKEPIAKPVAKSAPVIHMLTTTGYNFEGYKIVKYIGVISAETVLGTSALSDLTSSVADFFGGKSISYTTALTKAKTDALQKLIKRASGVGANALIGIAYNISVIGNNMLIASCDATAVVVELESKGEKIIEYPNKH